jgi:hypothetical protein
MGGTRRHCASKRKLQADNTSKDMTVKLVTACKYDAKSNREREAREDPRLDGKIGLYHKTPALEIITQSLS